MVKLSNFFKNTRSRLKGFHSITSVFIK